MLGERIESLGHTSGSTIQSPRPFVSSRRRWNQPSSSTKRSTPTFAARSASAMSVASSWSKYTASHVLSVTRRSPRTWFGSERSQRWKRAAMPSRPWPDHEKHTCGVA